MANQAVVAQHGVTPGKLALIAGLAVVLMVVLYIQLGGTFTKPRPNAVQSTSRAEPRVKRKTSTATTEATTAAGMPRKTGAVGQWQSPDLSTVAKYDPFALPAAFPQPSANDNAAAVAQTAAQTIQDASAQRAALEAERAESKTALESLKQQGVKVIIKKKDKYVAIIGDEEVHVGDQINGFTVIAINADGVQLAKDLSP